MSASDPRPSDDELARARTELGVPRGADDAELRRAFRTLARTHHPDVGGDPERFDRIRRAFALLSDDPAAPPTVTSGRPSRRAPTVHDPGSDHADLRPLEPDERREVLAGRLTLDAQVLVRWLVGERGLVGFSAASRAPGARANRLAHALAEGSTSTLTIATAPGGGSAALRVTLVARPRSARRALDALRLDGAERGRGWVRQRGSASTRLHQDHALGPRSSDAAAAAVAELDALLARLAWPLGHWRATGEAASG